MPAEPAVPVAKLEKLWRRFRHNRNRSYKDFSRKGDDPAVKYGEYCAWSEAAADLRAVIDEAKKGETR